MSRTIEEKNKALVLKAFDTLFNFGQAVNWIAADIVRINDGVLVEHWDVIQDEATREQSKSGQPMFGDSFASQP